MRLFFERYLLGGFVFQSAIVAGAYSSGAEMMEFFFPFGPWGGVAAIIVAAICFSLIFSVGFEYARRFKLYDYRSYMRHLLGRGWVLYEFLYVVAIILILSVIGAASGIVVNDMLGLSAHVGTFVMMASIGVLAFYGTKVIERFLSLWSLVLYAVYTAFFVAQFGEFGSNITATFESVSNNDGWLFSGMHYAGYVILIIPAMSFVCRHHETRKHAVVSGLLTGPLAMIPALLFYVVMMGHHGEISMGSDIPLTIMLGAMTAASTFMILCPLLLFGTFVETGIAFLHGLNERIGHVYEERGTHMPRWMRPAVAIGALLFSVYLARTIGLTDLVGQGYTTLAYGVILVFGVPLMTIGLKRAFGK